MQSVDFKVTQCNPTVAENLTDLRTGQSVGTVQLQKLLKSFK